MTSRVETLRKLVLDLPEEERAHLAAILLASLPSLLDRNARRPPEVDDIDWRTRIEVDPAVCHGRARIAGTRIMVSVVLDNLADGKSTAEIILLYPTLRREDVSAAVRYAAELARERELPTGRREIQER